MKTIAVVVVAWMVLILGLGYAFSGEDEPKPATNVANAESAENAEGSSGAPTSSGTTGAPGVATEGPEGGTDGHSHSEEDAPTVYPRGFEPEGNEEPLPPEVLDEAIADAELAFLAANGYPVLGQLPYKGKLITVTATVDPRAEKLVPQLQVRYRGQRKRAVAELRALMAESGDRLAAYDIFWRKG